MTSLWAPVITVVNDSLLLSPLRSCLKTSPVLRISACPLILGDDNKINDDNSCSCDDILEEYMDRWMDGWVDGWMDGFRKSVLYRHSAIIIPILQMRRMRLRQLKGLVQGHTTSKWWRLGLEPEFGCRTPPCNHYVVPKVLPLLRVCGSLTPSHISSETSLGFAVPSWRASPGFLEDHWISRHNTDICKSEHYFTY